jgi:hypothetical protein
VIERYIRVIVLICGLQLFLWPRYIAITIAATIYYNIKNRSVNVIASATTIQNHKLK